MRRKPEERGPAGAGLDREPALDAEHPWPGLASFSEAASHYFRGREREIDDLFRSVRRARCTVLYGISGLGKTSLLRAGLFPLLRQEGFLPVYVRLDHGHPSRGLSGQVADHLAAALAENGITVEGPDAALPDGERSVWEFFNREGRYFWNRRNRLTTPVLVFDQFEEIFTAGRADTVRRARSDAFLEELLDLVEQRLPTRLAERYEARDEAPPFDFGAERYRIVLGLREDFLPELLPLAPTAPSLMAASLRLEPMSGTQAAGAVKGSGGALISDGVDLRIAEYAGGEPRGRPAASPDELSHLTVDPAILSLVCFELNRRRIERGAGKITADLLSGHREEILADYYGQNVAALPRPVRVFIEEQLLTGDGRFRRPEAVEDFLAIRGVPAAELQRALEWLVSSRLVHVDSPRGFPTVELTHDVLTGVVKESRDRRRAGDAVRGARVRAYRATALVGTALVVSLGVAWFSHRQYAQAEAARRRADVSRGKAEELVNFMLGDLPAKLRPVGKLDLLDATAGKVGSYFADLPAEEVTDTTRVLQSRLLVNVGDIRQAQNDLPAALVAFRSALELAEQSLPSSPADITWRTELATAHDRVGGVLEKQRRFDEALRHFVDGLRIMEALAAEEPASVDWQQGVVNAHNSVGGVLEAQRKLDDALGHYRESLRIAAVFTAKDSGNADWQIALTIAHNRVGGVFEAQGKPDEALTHFRECQRIMERLTAQDHDNADWQKELAVANRRIGEVLWGQGKPDEALEHLREGRRIMQALTARDPANADWQGELSNVRDRIDGFLQLKGKVR